MTRKQGTGRAVLVGVLAGMLAGGSVWANGGPFVLKYPNGDPAAKGILARIDPDLKPARETRLKVVKEDLDITFGHREPMFSRGMTGDSAPLVRVSANYTITNPLSETVTVDFGFPIVRGVYISPYSMMPRPHVRVKVDDKYVQAELISNSAIYGIIRKRARDTIEAAMKKDEALVAKVKDLREASRRKRKAARAALQEHLTAMKGWSERDVTLMVEYAQVKFEGEKHKFVYPMDSTHSWLGGGVLNNIAMQNLGILGAIGEKKATQMLALLAGKFDPSASSDYEKIFAAWGGDIRERSVDLESGKVRPREVVAAKKPGDLAAASLGDTVGDPTIYARVDYLDGKAKQLTDEEKASCRSILKNLPVIFTFAPMNLLHYRVTFEPGAQQVVSVNYMQYAYRDTRGEASYQLAYVVHPASLWDSFGPINLTVKTPPGVKLSSSVPVESSEEKAPMELVANHTVDFTCHAGQVESKKGELFLAIDAAGWKSAMSKAVAAVNQKK